MISPSILSEKDHQGILNSYLHELINLTKPEKIFILAASYNYQITEDIFRKSPLMDLNSSKYSLFILYDYGGTLPPEKAWFRNYGRLQEQRPHQLEFMSMREFNEKINAGDKRLTQILLSGMLWFDRGQIPFAEPKLLIETE